MAKKGNEKPASAKSLVQKAGSDGKLSNKEALKIFNATGASYNKIGNIAAKNNINLGLGFTNGFGSNLNIRGNPNRPGQNSQTTYGHLNQTKDQILASYNTNVSTPLDPNATLNPEVEPESTNTMQVDQTMAPTNSANQFGAGSEVASFATGWKSRRGLRARAGRNAQGYASMRIAPTYASGIGTNYG